MTPTASPSRLSSRPWLSTPVLALAAFVGNLLVVSASAAQEKFWTLSGYKIHIAIAVDDAARPQPKLGKRVADYVAARIDATLDPLWKAEVSLIPIDRLGAEAGGLEQREHEALPDALRRFDKTQTLVATATATGYLIRAREYDAYARRWGAPVEQINRQPVFLEQQCFQALLDAFTPLATIRPLAGQTLQKQLVFKGSQLALGAQEQLFVKQGQVFQPWLRRTNRIGELVGGGLSPVAWTYLTAVEREGNQWLARVDSGLRQPFARRRGKVQDLAVALRHPPGETRVRFYARQSPERGLASYEVYRRNPEDSASILLGSTDADGAFTIRTDERRVVTLLLRSDGQLLAKVPVLPGAQAQIDVPIADDPARLRAQAELTEIREKLVDLVAQRAILMARARDLLDAGDVAQAQQLVNQLGELESRSVFERQISAAERIALADDLADAQVRTKIERMFAETRNLLGRFLDSRPISRLQAEVNEAARAGS